MFKVKNEAERATVYIYGTIGEDWWSPDDENRAKEFSKTLDELSPKPLDIRIDSAGGDVFEGFAIASAIQRYEGETHVYVDGLAASAASYIALMADKVTMNDYAMFMIHNAWAWTSGNSDALRDTAARLDALDDTIAGIIAARSSLALADVKAAMAAETWYRGDDALEAGLCDEVIETQERMAASLDHRIAAHFQHIPANISVLDGETDTEPSEPEAIEESEPIEAKREAECGAPDDGASHALPSIVENEAKVAAGAILLGNKVYRKENHGDQ